MTDDAELVPTPHGDARIHRVAAAGGGSRRATLMLGHGAGGSVSAPDIQAVAKASVAAGIAVVLVEQPYRVAGRKSAAPAPQLDAAWEAVVAHVRATGELGAAPLITGGRSSGARVACRTAGVVGAAGVLCLAFPLVAPSGVSRLPELAGAGVPVLVVQGRSDRFGMPRGSAAKAREVLRVEGDHGLKKEHRVIAARAVAWIDGLAAAGA